MRILLSWNLLGSDFGRTDFFADFYFWAAGFFRGFCRQIFSPHFCGKKWPEKLSRKIPAKILQNLYNKNPPTHFCRGAGPKFRLSFGRLLKTVSYPVAPPHHLSEIAICPPPSAEPKKSGNLEIPVFRERCREKQHEECHCHTPFSVPQMAVKTRTWEQCPHMLVGKSTGKMTNRPHFVHIPHHQNFYMQLFLFSGINFLKITITFTCFNA